jgi:hypothetical protein
MKIETHEGPGGLRVEFLDDPYTPVMVYLKRGSATFQCAIDTGEVEDETLSREQCAFLARIEDEANEHYNRYTINKEP